MVGTVRVHAVGAVTIGRAIQFAVAIIGGGGGGRIDIGIVRISRLPIVAVAAAVVTAVIGVEVVGVLIVIRILPELPLLVIVRRLIPTQIWRVRNRLTPKPRRRRAIFGTDSLRRIHRQQRIE